ncbi:MAG: M1 family metallopeptidase [Microscillaceae bacterium]|nr:M1 family metallopeptidase [Microscillaceae bacterium]
MKIYCCLCLLLGLSQAAPLLAQTPKPPYTSSKFEQLEELLPTPNNYRAADGAPGHEYWQQKADYKIEVQLNDAQQSLTGKENITYYNYSPNELKYLWVQLDQNRFHNQSDTHESQSVEMNDPGSLITYLRGINANHGFNILAVKDAQGKPLPHQINKTMMRIDLPAPLKAKGGTFSFSIEWNYRIIEQARFNGRAGYEFFPEDGNYLYEIAQWFPRMCVYDDVNGWQNKQFLGRGEFALPFGDYEVAITAPADHLVAATGELQNPEAVLSEEQRKRLKKAEKASSPVLIVSQEEAVANEKSRSQQTKTWIYKAQNVRDFAWASSRKFIWDAMRVEIEGKPTWAMSYYPKEGNPLWGQYSTNVVAHTLRVYSNYTIPYPYPVAISVHGPVFGMEYPMICFNGGRPQPDGTVPDLTRRAMISVIIHEVGHNFFPMIVNSDERQWTWMDEGLNSFCQYLAEKELPQQPWAKADYPGTYPSRRGPAKNIVPYMKADPGFLVPIMTNSEQIADRQFGNNAYGKPATALNILRETVMGPTLFDYAFKEYARRWAFKHPQPADFFRTMEDASAFDLDWFWRGWFYTTEACDIALDAVKEYQFTQRKNKLMPEETPFELAEINETLLNLLDEKDRKIVDTEAYYYELKLKNEGGLLMPVIVQVNYADGTSEIRRMPAEIWRLNPAEITRVVITNKQVASFVLDPQEETADIDTEDNAYPRKGRENSRFQKFKENKAQD